MSDADKLPSAEKLAELREEGVFPYSPFVTWGATLIGAFIGLIIAFSNLKLSFKGVFDLINSHDIHDLTLAGSAFKLVANILRDALLYPLTFASAFLIVAALGQTKFYHYFPVKKRKNKFSFTLELFTLLILILITFLTLIIWGGELLKFFNNDLLYFREYLDKVYLTLIYGLLGIVFIMIIIVRVINVIIFRYQHRGK